MDAVPREWSVSKKLVLADDCEDLRSVYAPLLRSRGYEVFEAADGAEAINLVERERPDLLLLDLWMPALNGFEVLERLRHDAKAARLKVIMLSNQADADYRLSSFENGAVEYLVKTLSLEDILNRVVGVLSDDELS